MKENANTDAARRCYWRWVWRGLLVMVALLAVAAGVFAWWLWGWRVGGLTFHESWTPEQRADLQELFDTNRRVVADSLAEAEMWEEAFAKLEGSENKTNAFAAPVRAWRYVEMSYAVRPFCVSINDILHRVAESGRADIYGKDNGYSAAHLAARCGKTELMKELVRRGNNPNQAWLVLPDDDPDCARYETPFQSAIACLPLSPVDRQQKGAPLAVRLELLEWLLEHGADINERAQQGTTNMTLLTVVVAAMNENKKLPAEEQGTLLVWLLDHGLQLDIRRNISLLGTYFEYMGIEGMRRVAEKLHFNELEPEYKTRILMSLLKCNMVTEDKVLWAVDELGADPNLILVSESESDEEALHAVSHPMKEFCRLHFLFFRASGDDDDEERYRNSLAVLDVLLARGAHLYDAEYMAPSDPALRERYFAVLKKNGQDPAELNSAQTQELCRLMEQTGTLSEVQLRIAQLPAKPNYLLLNELMKTTLSSRAEDAPEKLRWLLSEGAAVDDILVLQYCWISIWQEYAREENPEPEQKAAAFKHLQLLHDLLAAGAKFMLHGSLEPKDPELRARYHEIIDHI